MNRLLQLSLFLWDKLPVTRIDQLPQKTGDGFSLLLGQPEEQRNVVRGNKAYCFQLEGRIK